MAVFSVDSRRSGMRRCYAEAVTFSLYSYTCASVKWNDTAGLYHTLYITTVLRCARSRDLMMLVRLLPKMCFRRLYERHPEQYR